MSKWLFLIAVGVWATHSIEATSQRQLSESTVRLTHDDQFATAITSHVQFLSHQGSALTCQHLNIGPLNCVLSTDQLTQLTHVEVASPFSVSMNITDGDTLGTRPLPLLVVQAASSDDLDSDAVGCAMVPRDVIDRALDVDGAVLILLSASSGDGVVRQITIVLMRQDRALTEVEITDLLQKYDLVDLPSSMDEAEADDVEYSRIADLLIAGEILGGGIPVEVEKSIAHRTDELHSAHRRLSTEHAGKRFDPLTAHKRDTVAVLGSRGMRRLEAARQQGRRRLRALPASQTDLPSARRFSTSSFGIGPMRRLMHGLAATQGADKRELARMDVEGAVVHRPALSEEGHAKLVKALRSGKHHTASELEALLAELQESHGRRMVADDHQPARDPFARQWMSQTVRVPVTTTPRHLDSATEPTPDDTTGPDAAYGSPQSALMSLNADMLLGNNTEIVDYDDRILDVRCEADGTMELVIDWSARMSDLVLHTSSLVKDLRDALAHASELDTAFEPLILSGDAKWGCRFSGGSDITSATARNESGVAFVRRVLHAQGEPVSSDGHRWVYRLSTVAASLLDAFQGLDMKYESPATSPGGERRRDLTAVVSPNVDGSAWCSEGGYTHLRYSVSEAILVIDVNECTPNLETVGVNYDWDTNKPWDARVSIADGLDCVNCYAMMKVDAIFTLRFGLNIDVYIPLVRDGGTKSRVTALELSARATSAVNVDIVSNGAVISASTRKTLLLRTEVATLNMLLGFVPLSLVLDVGADLTATASTRGLLLTGGAGASLRGKLGIKLAPEESDLSNNGFECAAPCFNSECPVFLPNSMSSTLKSRLGRLDEHGGGSVLVDSCNPSTPSLYWYRVNQMSNDFGYHSPRVVFQRPSGASVAASVTLEPILWLSVNRIQESKLNTRIGASVSADIRSSGDSFQFRNLVVKYGNVDMMVSVGDFKFPVASSSSWADWVVNQYNSYIGGKTIMSVTVSFENTWYSVLNGWTKMWYADGCPDKVCTPAQLATSTVNQVMSAVAARINVPDGVSTRSRAAESIDAVLDDGIRPVPTPTPTSSPGSTQSGGSDSGRTAGSGYNQNGNGAHNSPNSQSESDGGSSIGLIAGILAGVVIVVAAAAVVSFLLVRRHRAHANAKTMGPQAAYTNGNGMFHVANPAHPLAIRA